MSSYLTPRPDYVAASKDARIRELEDAILTTIGHLEHHFTDTPIHPNVLRKVYYDRN